METGTSYIPALNRGLRIFFSEFVRVSLRRPSQAAFFARTVLWQGRAARKRARLAREGVTVPPIAIFSITNRCNLPFKGRRSPPSWARGSSWKAASFPPPPGRPMEPVRPPHAGARLLSDLPRPRLARHSGKLL